LLRGRFRPVDGIVALRGYLRHRATLIENAGALVQRMQKALVQMNAQHPRDPHWLAQHLDYRCHASEAEIVAALTGNYRAEHLFVLQQTLELFDRYQQQLTACDGAIEAHLAHLTA